MSDFLKTIEESFGQYAGAVIQSRAITDARDCLKPSARQIFYSMYLNKMTADKPAKKTNNAVGQAMVDFYIHGDASCEGIIMRAGQSFAMRYPLIEITGNAGTLIDSGNWAAPRYTSARLSKLGTHLFEDIDKDTITEWRDNYDDTKQYPMVVPSKGFYNLVNGSQGIGVGLASSIPQFNLKELNAAVIKLLENEDVDFEDIAVVPDFATGGILLNKSEVMESLRVGTGASCKLRSVVNFDSKERCLVVTEIPYGVYTNTICKELEAACEAEDNPGIERFNDLTGKTPLIKIYLKARSNPDAVLKYLYKNTSLQSFYGINMTMLEDGRFPKVYGWKALLTEHITHEKTVYRRAFEYDLAKKKLRAHIVEGIIKAIAQIDEVIHTIKASESTDAAKAALCELLSIDVDQAKAILDIKLARLAHLEVRKYEEELESLRLDITYIEHVLSDETVFKQVIIGDLQALANKFGDARRTQVKDIETEGSAPVEIKALQISLSNKNNLYVSELSSLYTQKRGGIGSKVKLAANEYLMMSTPVESTDTILFFTKDGNYTYKAAAAFLGEEKYYLDIPDICAMTSLNPKNHKNYIIFITKNGYVKKSVFSEYNITRQGTKKAIDLEEGDEIASVLFVDEERVGIYTNCGNFLLINTSDIRPIGRLTRGIHGIKLNDDDFVGGAHVFEDGTSEVISVSGLGLIKRTSLSEFPVQGKNTKGSKIQKLNDGDWLADVLPVVEITEVLVAATSSCIRIPLSMIPLQGKATLGVKAITLKNSNENIISLSEV